MSPQTPTIRSVLTQVALVALAGLSLYGAFWVDIPWLRAVLVLAAAVMVWWVVVQQVRLLQISGEFWCYFLYIFGAVSCILDFFPPPELQQAQESREGNWSFLYFGMAFILIGASIHAFLFFRGRAGKESLKQWAIILCGIILIAIPYTYLKNRGYDFSLPAFLLVFPLAVIAILGATVFFILPPIVRRRLPVNRMARLIGEKKYREAIEYGESLPPDARRPEVEYNAAVAYKLLGENNKARELFEQLQRRTDVPQVIADAIKARLAELGTTGPLS